MAAGKGTTKTTPGAAAPTPVADTVEQQVIAFAEQLGRIVGTVQAKAEGWLDRESLRQQVSQIRDSASALLEQLVQKTSKNAMSPSGGGATRGRSGGKVDAPGKKHRKPAPSASVRNVSARANAADAGRIAKMKMANRSQRRGRG